MVQRIQVRFVQPCVSHLVLGVRSDGYRPRKVAEALPPRAEEHRRLITEVVIDAAEKFVRILGNISARIEGCLKVNDVEDGLRSGNRRRAVDIINRQSFRCQLSCRDSTGRWQCPRAEFREKRRRIRRQHRSEGWIDYFFGLCCSAADSSPLRALK